MSHRVSVDDGSAWVLSKDNFPLRRLVDQSCGIVLRLLLVLNKLVLRMLYTLNQWVLNFDADYRSIKDLLMNNWMCWYLMTEQTWHWVGWELARDQMWLFNYHSWLCVVRNLEAGHWLNSCQSNSCQFIRTILLNPNRAIFELEITDFQTTDVNELSYDFELVVGKL